MSGAGSGLVLVLPFHYLSSLFSSDILLMKRTVEASFAVLA